MEYSSTTPNQRQETPARRLCSGGCGFFVMADIQGLCSKCYNDYLIQITNDFEKKLVLLEKEESLSRETGDAISKSSSSAKTRTKCSFSWCRKKLGLLGFVCRCGESFCGMHRLPEVHGCGIDFKKAGRFAIADENPRVVPDKIAYRI